MYDIDMEAMYVWASYGYGYAWVHQFIISLLLLTKLLVVVEMSYVKLQK